MVDIEVYSKAKQKSRQPAAEWLPSTPFLMGVSGPSLKAQALSLLGRNDEAIACMQQAAADASKIKRGKKMKARAEGMANEQVRQLEMIGKPLMDFSVKAHKSGAQGAQGPRTRRTRQAHKGSAQGAQELRKGSEWKEGRRPKPWRPMAPWNAYCAGSRPSRR